MLLKGALEAMLIAIHKFGGGGLEFVGGFTVFNLQSARKPDRISLMRRMFRPHFGGLAILVSERIDSGIEK